nr:MAG: Thioredoxin domain protein [Bacteriophage sp.]
MTIDTILNSPDIYVLFDGCPTCRPETAKFLDSCRTTAQWLWRQLHIVPSGSPTATLIRTIAKNQHKPIEYPLVLFDGKIHYTPAEILNNNERTTK